VLTLQTTGRTEAVWEKTQGLRWHLVLPHYRDGYLGSFGDPHTHTRNCFLDEIGAVCGQLPKAKGLSAGGCFTATSFRKRDAVDLLPGFRRRLIQRVFFYRALLIEVNFLPRRSGPCSLRGHRDATCDYPVMFGTLYIFNHLLGARVKLIGDITYNPGPIPRIDFESREGLSMALNFTPLPR